MLDMSACKRCGTLETLVTHAVILLVTISAVGASLKSFAARVPWGWEVHKSVAKTKIPK